MMKKRKIATMSMALIMTVILLAGCGSSSAPAEPAEQGSAANSPTPAEDSSDKHIVGFSEAASADHLSSTEPSMTDRDSVPQNSDKPESQTGHLNCQEPTTDWKLYALAGPSNNV